MALTGSARFGGPMTRDPDCSVPAPLPGRGSCHIFTGGSLRVTTGYHRSPLRGAEEALPGKKRCGPHRPTGKPLELAPLGTFLRLPASSRSRRRSALPDKRKPREGLSRGLLGIADDQRLS